MGKIYSIYDVYYSWPDISLSLTSRDLRSLVCTSKVIRTEISRGFREKLIDYLQYKIEDKKSRSFTILEMTDKLKILDEGDLLCHLISGEAYRILGLVTLTRREFDKINENSIVPASPVYPYVLTAKASLCVWSGNIVKAKELLDQSAAIEPQYALTHVCFFEVLKNIDKEKAFECLSTALKIEPTNTQALDIIRNNAEEFLIQFFEKKFEEQQKFLATYFEISTQLACCDTHNVLCHLIQGEIYRIQGLFMQAHQEFDKIDETLIAPTSPIYPYVLTAKAIVCIWNNDTIRAKELLDKSLEIKPKYVPTNLALFEVLKNRDNQKAFEYASIALSIDPKNLHGQLVKAEIYYYAIKIKQNYKAAKLIVLHAIENYSKNKAYSLHFYFLRAGFYKSKREFFRAAADFKEIVSRKDAKDALLFSKANLGVAMCYLGMDSYDPQMVRAHLDSASQTENIEDLYTIAKQLVRLKSDEDMKKAREILDRVIQKNPQHHSALRLRDTIASKFIKESYVLSDPSIPTVTLQKPDENSIEAKCRRYLELSFREKVRRAEKMQQEIQLLADVGNPAACCCLGEVFFVIGKMKEMKNYFSRLEASVPANFPNPQSTAMEFYIASRFGIYLLYKDFYRGLQLLKQASLYQLDATTEYCIAHSEQLQFDPRKLEKLFLIDPTNLFVWLGISEDIFRNKNHTIEIYLILHNFLSRILEQYPNDCLLLLNYTKAKQKINGIDKKIIWDLFCEVIHKTEDESSPVYVESIILRAELFVFSLERNCYSYSIEDIYNELVCAVKNCTDPELLMKAAHIFETGSRLFQKKSYFESLQAALKAFSLDQKNGPEIRKFINGLYLRGGFGVMQNNELAKMWGNVTEDDDAIPWNQCSIIAEGMIDVNLNEALEWFTKALICANGDGEIEIRCDILKRMSQLMGPDQNH